VVLFGWTDLGYSILIDVMLLVSSCQGHAPDFRFEVSAYINNITNKYYKAFGFDISPFDNNLILTSGKPCWVGANFKFRWN